MSTPEIPTPTPTPPTPTVPPANPPVVPPLPVKVKGGIKIGDIVFAVCFLTLVGVMVYIATSEKE